MGSLLIMQINYPFSVGNRAGFSPMWYAPTIDNTARDMDVPPVYFPYACEPGWPPSITNGYCPALSDDSAITPAAPTTAAAVSPTQALAPITLVNPLPSITPPPPGSAASNQIPVAVAPVSAECSLATWVTGNPGLATAAAIMVYLLFAGGSK